MDDGKLIQLVKQNAALYNKKHPFFKNRKKRMSIWTNVAMEMDMPVDLCTRRWTTLRDRYSKECRLTSDLSKNGEIAESSWQYMDAMHFIKPYIIGRLSRRTLILQHSNTDPLCLPLENTVQHYDLPTDRVEPEPPSLSKCISKGSPAPSIASSVSSRKPSLSASPVPASTPLILGKKRKVDIDNIFYEAIKAFKKIRVAREIKTENACIKGFGDMITAAISGMSERKQAKAMQKAIEIVMTIKMQPDD